MCILAWTCPAPAAAAARVVSAQDSHLPLSRGAGGGKAWQQVLGSSSPDCKRQAHQVSRPEDASKNCHIGLILWCNTVFLSTVCVQSFLNSCCEKIIYCQIFFFFFKDLIPLCLLNHLRTSAKNVNVFLVFLLKKFVRADVCIVPTIQTLCPWTNFFLLFEKIVHSFLFKDMYFKVIQ
jgi:hypothetical protein